jgi:hypothetical protein
MPTRFEGETGGDPVDDEDTVQDAGNDVYQTTADDTTAGSAATADTIIDVTIPSFDQGQE